jgi:isopentenyl diphosphate isomerase/L-lactate dehydrogenase-like FMN-dependent dehydrogenase
MTMHALNIDDLREIARRRLPRGLFEFVDRGAEDEVALRNNRLAFEAIKLNPRGLVDVSDRSQEISIFGRTQQMPLAIAPTGCAGLMWMHGAIAQARAARDAGIPFALSTASTSSIETIAEQAHGATLWFQLYLWNDITLSHQLMARAAASGYHGLIVTIDSIAKYEREYNIRNGFSMPFRLTRRNVADVLMRPRWLADVLLRYLLTSGMPKYENYPRLARRSITSTPGKAMSMSETMTWEDFRTVRSKWQQALIVKGILCADDAIRARDCGADGVVVSNHGGRHLDSARAPIDVLPEVAEAVGGQITVMVDSGFRRGSDVVKARALGADCVLIGRPALYGTAYAGQEGTALAIEIFRREIDRVLVQIGCKTVNDVRPTHVVRP